MRPRQHHSLLIALKRDARTFVCLCMLVLVLSCAQAATAQNQPGWASICSASGNAPFGNAGNGSHDGCQCVLDCGCTCPGHSKIPVPGQAVFYRPQVAWSILPDTGPAGPSVPAVSVVAHGIRAPPVPARHRFTHRPGDANENESGLRQ